MKKLRSIYALINKLNDQELSILATYLSLHFVRKDLFLKVIFDHLFQVVHNDHGQVFANLFSTLRNKLVRLVCPFMSVRELCALSASGPDFKAVISLRDLLAANLRESADNLRLLRAWLIQNIDNLRNNNNIHAKIYMSGSGAYITSCNLSKNGKHVNLEAGVFSATNWFRDKAAAIFDEWWETGEVLTIETINEAFRTINRLEEKPRSLNVKALLVELNPVDYAAALNRVAGSRSSTPVATSNPPLFRDTSPKSIFTYYFISLINALGIKTHIPNLIDTYFNILRWQKASITIPSDLAPLYIRLAAALVDQKISLHGHKAVPVGKAGEPTTLLIDDTDDVDRHASYWKERPLAFVELFDKELHYRARRYVKKSRAISVTEEVCTPGNMGDLRQLRRNIEARIPRPLHTEIVMDPQMVPLADQIISYQLTFLEKLHKAVAKKGAPLFHNTWLSHNGFFVDYYLPKEGSVETTYLLERSGTSVDVAPLSDFEAACVCQLFSQDAISDEGLVARGLAMFRSHLQAHFECIGNIDDETLEDLYAAFMGTESFETIHYLATTSKS